MLTKKNLLVVASSYPVSKGDFNGIFVHELSKRLTAQHNVIVVCPYKTGLKRRDVFDGVTIYRHNQFVFNNINLAYGIGLYENLKRNPLLFMVIPFYFLYLFFAIKRMVKKYDISVIHAHWLIPNGFIAALYKKLLNKKIRIISTMLGSDLRNFNTGFGKIIKNFTLKVSDELSVLTNAQRQEFKEICDFKDTNVIPLGVDTSVFNPNRYDESLKVELDIKGPFILFCGILTEAKGIHHLIRAMKVVIEKYPEAKLAAIGQGSIKAELIATSDSLGITNHIIFLGPFDYEELPRYYATADVFVLPSYAEALGMVIAESMSCGTLPLASGFPDEHDVLKNDNSLRLEVGNEEVIANKILHVLNNSEDYKSHIENGLTHIRENFEWDKIVSSYVNLLSKYKTTRA